MNEAAALVYVVDDDPSVRRALTRLIRSAGHEVEAYGSAREFLEHACGERTPACVVLDVQLPDLSGLELQRELDARLPIVFLTGHGDIAMTVGAIKAGATDFLTKPVRDDDLLRAIDLALARSVEVSKSIHELEELRSRVGRLTVREREVMNLVVLGRLNKQVACELGTVEKTVKAHRARVMQKMEVGSLAELVRIADKVAVANHAHAANHLPEPPHVHSSADASEPASGRIRDQGPIPPTPAVS
ncbi:MULTISPECIES: response regulator [Paraburkholderia]|jgi:FixJ family two-component response regulator|uniref:DNA-binding response regulator n=1 Tax=Paraburkholderia largidicola TaxID=3014751 RepID=A0A7I8BH25_9BURK|nr:MULTISPECIES: response regulator [Paraburkholderia]BEU20556.1 response regulator [Paraburkholderia sp. 22B1P]GJH37123.1 response regulator [Paraburkholderia hospita]CAG9259692.1 Nodulation protein W [Paraburkholderia caribensis]BCF87639.1 DNA-binding response regulator [Paraburkholderia sp. PGU16]GJH03027.1 response regulator [Paraburkholderia terrae]